MTVCVSTAVPSSPRLVSLHKRIDRLHCRSRSTTVRRMGAWVNDRFAEEEVVPINQGPRRRKTSGILGDVCDGGGPGGISQSSKNFKSSLSSPSLLLLRRQFTRQLYEWSCLPLFKSRTKLNQFGISVQPSR